MGCLCLDNRKLWCFEGIVGEICWEGGFSFGWVVVLVVVW